MDRIALHKMAYLQEPAIISTVRLCAGVYETMVMWTDGEEIESFRTSTLDQATRLHGELVAKWNDKIFNGSIAKLVGGVNRGQFVQPISELRSV